MRPVLSCSIAFVCVIALARTYGWRLRIVQIISSIRRIESMWYQKHRLAIESNNYFFWILSLSHDALLTDTNAFLIILSLPSRKRIRNSRHNDVFWTIFQIDLIIEWFSCCDEVVIFFYGAQHTQHTHNTLGDATVELQSVVRPTHAIDCCSLYLSFCLSQLVSVSIVN